MVPLAHNVDWWPKLGMSLCFFKGQLEMISLAVCDDRFGTSWDDWSEVKERDRTEATRLWLEEVGFPVGDYSWGSVWAEFDAKGASVEAAFGSTLLAKPIVANVDEENDEAGQGSGQVQRACEPSREDSFQPPSSRSNR